VDVNVKIYFSNIRDKRGGERESTGVNKQMPMPLLLNSWALFIWEVEMVVYLLFYR
jgi:hypothetical protein